MIRTSLSVLVLLPLSALADQPVVVAPALAAGNGVPAAVATQFDATFRQELGRKATLVAADPTGIALSKLGETTPCNTDACSRKLAAEVGARFVVSAVVSATDDIYEVKLSVWDAGKNERAKVIEGKCELCTSGEVNGTITNAVARLDEVLAAPLVAAEPPKPVTVPFELKTTPSGARVLVDGKDSGMTPLLLDLTPGKHTLQVTRQDYLPATRIVALEKDPVNLLINLEPEKPVAVAPVSVAPPTAPPAAPPSAAPATEAAVVVAPPVPAATGGKALYSGIAWGMTIGGAALAGVGTWLILLDGDVTCSDQGRSSCPTVYNTKGVGIAGLGIGSALIGAAVAIFAVGPSEPAMVPTVEAGPAGGMLHWGGTF